MRELDLTCADLVENRFDQRRLDGEGRICQRREPLDRSNDGGSSRHTIESVETEGVREEPGDPTGEPIELRERVLTERDEHVDAERRAQHGRQCLRERPGPAFAGVVEEVLLRLVEHEVDVPLGLRCREGVPG